MHQAQLENETEYMKWLNSDPEQQSSQDFEPWERQEINEVRTTITPNFYLGALSGLQRRLRKL